MWTNQVGAALSQPIAQGIRVGGSIIDQSGEPTAWATRSLTRHRNLRQQGLNQGHFVRRRRGKFDSQRHTLAVYHHFADSTAGLVFVTSFLDRAAIREYLPEIAWETEVWVADAPGHLIHFNGQRFLGPYEGTAYVEE